jgi:AcrR family transcriptional regulator
MSGTTSPSSVRPQGDRANRRRSAGATASLDPEAETIERDPHFADGKEVSARYRGEMRYKAGIETRDRILEATRSLLARDGLEGTTIKAICDEAGVLPGSFYNLFDSKEEAILSVVRQAIEAVDPDPAHEGRDTLEDLVKAFVQFMEEDADLARVYIRIAVSGGGNNTELKGRVLRHHENRVGRFADAMQRAAPTADATELERRAETLVSALNGIALHRVLDSEFDVAWHAGMLLEDAVLRYADIG